MKLLYAKVSTRIYNFTVSWVIINCNRESIVHFACASTIVALICLL